VRASAAPTSARNGGGPEESQNTFVFRKHRSAFADTTIAAPKPSEIAISEFKALKSRPETRIQECADRLATEPFGVRLSSITMLADIGWTAGRVVYQSSPSRSRFEGDFLVEILFCPSFA
jgi:hypothetical protein